MARESVSRAEIVDQETGELVPVAGGIGLGVGQWTKTALVLPRSLSFDEWERVGQALRMVEGSVQWWLGDWCNFGERAYGEKYSQAVEATDYEYGTVANASYVASRFESSRRRETLSFGHHQNVAALDPGIQDGWLSLAESERWSVQELRARLKKAKLVEELGELQARPFPSGQFVVVHADPPWSYSNSGFDQSAASTYPTMATDDICALPVPGIAADPSVLFLWATSPLLPDAFRVMAAWGFTYKASLVWVKDRAPGMGWWVETRHELLLIGARGDMPHPLVQPVSLLDGAVTDHSRKPNSAYDAIEAMYPEVPRVELFARRSRPGWDSWGNQSCQ
jgi:N6-adenosine-specific RNA methylase IME4